MTNVTKKPMTPALFPIEAVQVALPPRNLPPVDLWVVVALDRDGAWRLPRDYVFLTKPGAVEAALALGPYYQFPRVYHLSDGKVQA